MRPVLDSLFRWLNGREDVKRADLAHDADIGLPSGARLVVRCAPRLSGADMPYLHAIRYEHADRELAGRRWITEVGFRADREVGYLEATVVLSTDDVAPERLPEPTPSRPALVSALLRFNAPESTTPGLRALPLTLDGADALRSHLHSSSRRHPVLIISPAADGTPLVNTERLRRLLEGLADLYVIEPNVDTRALALAVGADEIPWGGGVRVVYPSLGGAYLEVPVYTLRPQTLENWRDAAIDAEARILGLVGTRTVRAILPRHVSVDQVHEEQIRRRISRTVQLRVDAASATLYSAHDERELLRAEVELLRGDLEATLAHVTDLRGQVESEQRDAYHYLDEAEKAKAALHDAEQKAAALQHAFDQMPARATQNADETDQEVRSALTRQLCESATLADVLRLVSFAFPTQLVVLDSAWKSAERAHVFNRPDVAAELLCKLCGEYREALAAGASDGEAKKVFGKRFASRESTLLTKEGRRRRTFAYQGEEIEMLAHLKDGRKESDAETLRIHFHWDAAAKVIVVGHCGAHLNFD